MKKTVLLIAALAAIMGCNVSAQDTLHIRIPPSNYFTDIWPASFYSAGEDTFRCNMLFYGQHIRRDAEAFRKYTKDTLIVYGIAASLISEKDRLGEDYFVPELYLDTTYNEVYDYLRLYEAGASELIPIGEPLKVHMHVTPISYYIDLDAYPIPVWQNEKWPSLPMYESYFRTPVTVVDSFYVGREYHAYRFAEGYTGTTMMIELPKVGPGRVDTINIYQYSSHYAYYPPFNYSGPIDSSYFRWIYDTTQSDFNRLVPLMFPIIAPPDTTIVSNDTIIISDTIIVCDTLIVADDTIIRYDTIVITDTILSLPDASFLGRLTGVMPNPAAEAAKVVSSFGLSRVEAYNLAGEKVDELQLPSPSLSATLDIRRWPVGAYILRIHTPQGVATKKLSVAR